MRKCSFSGGGLVYSTESGTMCPVCRNPVSACSCKRSAAIPSADGQARISRSTKGRGGKTVTLVSGLGLDDAALAALGKQLKAACGSGGTVKDGVIEVQGEHASQLLAALSKLGIKARLA